MTALQEVAGITLLLILSAMFVSGIAYFICKVIGE